MLHYWRTNLATAVGLAIAAGVLAGAYTVGDSVRQSLRDIALSRIGATHFAIVSNGFFREELAATPLIALEGVVTHDRSGRRAASVDVYGVDGRFWNFHGQGFDWPQNNDVLLSPALARELGVNPTDDILVRLPRVSPIPAESLHSNKEDPGRTLRARMRQVVGRESMGEFSLRVTQGEVRAVFLPLERLQREFDLKGRVNTGLLASRPDLRSSYRLEDIGVRYNTTSPFRPQVEADSIIITDYVTNAVRSVDGASRPVLTYLANSVRAKGRETPYSLVAATDRPDLPSDDSIVLNDWIAKDLRAKVGDSVELEYFLWDPSGRLVTRTASFRVSAVVPLDPTDRELAPEYPGITEAQSVADWDPPFPVDLKRVRPVDEEYWRSYRATPKAYITLAAGQRLWRSRYGGATSILVSPGFSPERLRAAIDPQQAGLSLINVRSQVLAASEGATDFGEYFLYFSFFLVISALLLAGMLFRFGVEQRAGEIRTLQALGYSRQTIRKLFMLEGFPIALAGGVLGLLFAALYAGGILTGLRTWWIGAMGTTDLALHLSWKAVLVSVAASLLIGAGVTALSLRERKLVERRSRARIWALICALAGVGMLFVGGAGGFFGSGFLLLAAALFAFRAWLSGTPGRVRSVGKLGLRYTAHRPGRSVLCIALTAFATFLIVSIDAFRRDVQPAEAQWRFFAESSLPILYDPNSAEGRDALDIVVDAKWLSFRLRPGDDASCLNLYAPRTPRVLGVPTSFRKFRQAPAGTIAAAVDANTLQYALHRKIGDTIDVGGARLTITEALHDSVFQSEILISDADFQRVFPDEFGYRVFLIDAPAGADAALEKTLATYGFDATTTAERLAAFHRVENTYLSTFQSLGGLGLVLGTVGIATVLLRNLLERRRELALLRAVGYGPRHISLMTLSESMFLLVAGVGSGTAAALVAVMPAVLGRGGSPPFTSIAILAATVLAAGLLSSLVAVQVVNRSPILSALRSE